MFGTKISLSSAVDDVVARLLDRLFQIAQTDGDYMTAIPAISVHRRSQVTDSIPCIYEFGLAITLSGRKQVTVGTAVFEYGAGQALFASVDMPAVSCVTQAPYVGMMLRLNRQWVMQMASGMNLPVNARDDNAIALSKATLDIGLLTAVERLVALIEEPHLLPSVAPLIQQEIIARLLASAQGTQCLLLNTVGSASRHITQSMAWLKQHFMEPIGIETLATQAHMSPSTFRQHFKAIAGVSPLQYVKQLRLQEARQLMLNQGLDAGASGLKVGYESVTQFSREYARLFGEPPLRDIKQLRERGDAHGIH